MIYMYTNKNIPKDSELIHDVEAEYRIQISKNWNKLMMNKVILDIHRIIDKAEINSDMSLNTPFGVCAPYDCSTGAKVAILAYYYRNEPKILINVAECGGNVISLLTKLNRYKFYTYNSSYNTFGFSGEHIVLNGEVVTIREATRRIIAEKREACSSRKR